jgi:hypothetical protein
MDNCEVYAKCRDNIKMAMQKLFMETAIRLHWRTPGTSGGIVNTNQELQIP